MAHQKILTEPSQKHKARSQTAFYYIFQSITVQFSTVSILHPAHRGTPTDRNEIQKVNRYIRVQSSIILMEREKGIHLSWIAFSLVAIHEYITFIVHHRRKEKKKKKKKKVKICHNFNKSASVYSENVVIQMFWFSNLRPMEGGGGGGVQKVLVWTVCEDISVLLCVWRFEGERTFQG